MSDFEPKVVCFSCKFSWGYLADEDVLSSKIKNWVPIICSGKVDTKHVVEAFKHGADGVLILGCPEGDCHYQDGNLEARKRMYLLQKTLQAYGIEPERVSIQLARDPEGTTTPDYINRMSESIKKLGPVRRAASPVR
jgi:coenzyme F420-reducing hydrogenase delta subunit